MVRVRSHHALAFALALINVVAASAQDAVAPIAEPPVLFASAQPASAQQPGTFFTVPEAAAPNQKRPSLLVPMYVSFAALQALDYQSTTRAIRSGAGREANPAMQSVVGNRPAFIAVKAATAAGAIWAGEKIWKKNRIAAVALMAAMNGAVGAVVAHNMSVR
jgi:hypothetical protein